MFTNKDIEYRTIFVINCFEKRAMRVSCGELLIEDVSQEKKVVITKVPFQKILALFIIGHLTITTPLIEKCKQNNIAVVVMKANLRPVFFYADAADANYLLRKRQYLLSPNDITIAKHLMYDKFSNQLELLRRTRKKDKKTTDAEEMAKKSIEELKNIYDYSELMGTEGRLAKAFFAAYFQQNKWRSRMPRTKIDPINVTLDIGYSILFNFIEAFAKMFGFDVYCGVYHRLWFKRKSLICDLMEPFRCIIDHAVRNAFNRGQFSEEDFELKKNEYFLDPKLSMEYYKVFYNALIVHKQEIFKYLQTYYRCFMRNAGISEYPHFEFK